MNRNRLFQTTRGKGSWKRILPLGITLLALVSMVMTALAASVVVDLATGQEDMVIRGDNGDGYLSEIATSADFNGDGVSDLLIGAAGHNRNGQYSGAAYVVIGNGSLPASKDLATSPANVTIYGRNQNHAFGHAVAGGDINGDGFKDLIIAADGEEAGRGVVYVFLSSSDLGAVPTTIDLKATPDAAALKIKGEGTNWRFGRSVASGDVNKDGIDDIIIGSYYASPGERPQAGAVYVVLGSTAYTGATSTTYTVTERAALTVYGAAGDPDGTTSTLKAKEISLGEQLLRDDQTLQVGELGDRLGHSVAIADIDQDGIADVIAGAYGANVGSNSDAGKTYVFRGSTSYTEAVTTTIDLSTNPGGANHTINGVAASDQSGFYVGAGDLNKDSYQDILIGAYKSTAETGKAYAVYSKAGLENTIDLASSGNLTVTGTAPGDRLGRSLASGDINKDGFDDFIIGASRASPNGRTGAGAAYVFYGKASLTGSVSAANADMIVWGEGTSADICSESPFPVSADCSDEAGFSTASGDINGDQIDDLVIGSIYANNGALIDAGAAFVIFGEPNGSSLPATSITITPTALTAYPGQQVPFMVNATDSSGYSWNATSGTTFSISEGAGGSWVGNLYTTQNVGTFTVTATYQGKTATATLTVAQVGAPVSITITPKSNSAGPGEAVIFYARARDASNNEWDVTSQAIFTIASGAGGKWAKNVYTAQNPGTWTVTAAFGGFTDTATLTVNNQPVPGDDVGLKVFLPQVLNIR